MFPTDDKFWREVRVFIDYNKNSEDVIVAPVEFFEVIPSIIPDFILKYDMCDNTVKIGEKKLQIDWFIIHKGRLNNIDFDVLKLIAYSFKPVFANNVFVIFTRLDKSLPEIAKKSDHYKALIIEIEKKKNLVTAKRKEIKNVIMVSIDNLRFDCIGYQPDKNELIKHNVLNLLETPNLDAIASKSICFTQAISTSPYTTASHASIITGLYPPRNGVRAFYDTKLSENIQTLAEIFQKEGYVTILATDTPEIWKPIDLHRGFSEIFERDDKKLYQFLDLKKDKKIFLFIHFFDVHEPFGFSEYEIYKGYNSDYYKTLEQLCIKYNVKFTKEKPFVIWNILTNDIVKKDINVLLPLYVRGVSKFDNGRFKEFIKNMKNLKFLKNSLMVILSDHGEGRSSIENPNHFAHGGTLYDNVIRVPLIIYYKGITAQMTDVQVSTVDIFPTILDLSLGKIPVLYDLDGKSLVNLINNKLINNKEFDDTTTYSEVWIADREGWCLDDQICNLPTDLQWLLFQRCIRTREKKYIVYGKPEILENYSFLDDDNFLKEIYRYLFLRFDSSKESMYYTDIINKYQISRHEFLNLFLQMEDYTNKNTVLYDLVNDPVENNPRPINHLLSLSLTSSIERRAIITRKIFPQERTEGEKTEDEKIITDRLKSLGYFS